MTKPFYSLQEVNPSRYKVIVDVLCSQHELCEIALYTSTNKWYVVKEGFNYELSEQALKFIYESVKRLNEGAV